MCGTTATWQVLGSTCTGADGTYAFAALAPRKYYVGFVGYPSRWQRPLCGPNPRGYLRQYYDGASQRSTADPVSVAAGTTTSGIDAALQAGGQVTGKLTDAVTGAAAPNVMVWLYDASGNPVASTCSASDGTYRIGGLAGGEYRVYLADPVLLPGSCGPPLTEPPYPPQYYSGKWSLGTADPVAVTVGTTTAGIDAALQVGGQITGEVTDEWTHAPIQHLYVIVQSSTSGYWQAAATDASGDYTFTGLPTGTYSVLFNPPSMPLLSPYPSQYYHGKTSPTTADLVSVRSGSTTSGVNDALTPPWGAISGKVTDASTGAGAPNVDVVVYDASGTVVASACTAADGTYTVQRLTYGGYLPSGSYRVAFSSSARWPFGPCGTGSRTYATQYYSGKSSPDAADPVSVPDGMTTSGIDATLQRLGKITGKVTNAATSAAVPDVGVSVYDSSGNLASATCTKADGTYTVRGLGRGTYHVAFADAGAPCGGNPPSYLSQYYNGKSSLAAADPVSVTAGASIADVDAALQPSGQITPAG
jgi:5-hydroxyisourate hydrolase-like protein (transthyretin family)